MTKLEEVLEIKRYGRWKVRGSVGNGTHVKCVCDCGVEKEVRVGNLINGSSKSCGCLVREAFLKRSTFRGGRSNHRLYGTYHDAYRRCYDSRRKDYKHYGGRGIVMCDRWIDYEEGFNNFIEDMEGSWEEGLELERQDCDGNYEPSNCCWVSRKQQTNNRRTNHRLNYQGIILNISEWADLMNIKNSTLSDRVCKLRWSDEDALSYDNKKVTKYTLNDDEYPTLVLLFSALGVQVSNITQYLRGNPNFFDDNNIVRTWSNERGLEEVLKYLTDASYKPDWETPDLLYIKNKYKYYKENL